ncbi:hypothetical protein OC842_003760 [Tilletia horrida]|uniref:Jacalin-type lectin domain-containing protein n=1 Tax=Tilletia horrida TaxID=155126 RepID=A0AAN6JJW1_9BASI|nr:hypothetical protein OC842_003760 [Tilletia horrida]
MVLLLAPYSNSMRLGQGFNSYTQEICIDDAVIVSPYRAENFLTNDGQTMRTRAGSQADPSIWTSTQEVLVDEDRLREAQQVWKQEQQGYTSSDIGLERQEKIRAMQRKEQAQQMTASAVNPPLSTAPPPYRESPDSAFITGTKKTWNIDNIGGPSQTVTFTSRFVDSLSSVVKDMGISASLSIKAGTVAGSGRGSFIDSDKFLKSDLNYYISVRVTNQSTNFKDPLEFNPLPQGKVADSDFLKVYGDSYISGFLEGGEFNALVSMNVLNTAKLTQIEAAAKVAFSTGALDVEASASFGMAKSNIALNTETTITCSWTGGGVIKPPAEPWTIDSLMRAAARFPENVACSPQRTHAILTKYDHLRSYLALKPSELSKVSYENVAAYTDELLDSFMVYKSLLSTLQTDIREIQTGVKRFKPDQEADQAEKPNGFEVSLDGLEAACQGIRPQLSRIVERIELLERWPEALSDPQIKAAGEPYESPVAFWERLPIIETVKSGLISRPPLTGLRIGAPAASSKKDATASGRNPAELALMANLCEPEPASLSLTGEEDAKILNRIADLPKGTVDAMHLTRPVGSRADGKPFFALDFLKPGMNITHLSVGVAQGAVASISVLYDNGVQWRRGRTDDEQEFVQLDNFAKDETIVSGTIEFGKPVPEQKPPKDGATPATAAAPATTAAPATGSAPTAAAEPTTAAAFAAADLKGTVTSLHLKTSTGRTLYAAADKQSRYGYQCRYLDGRLFTDLEEYSFEPPMKKAVLLGFYGMSIEKGEKAGVHRLGFVWCTQPVLAAEANQRPVTLSATVTQPLVGVQHAPATVGKPSRTTLLPSEQAYLSDPLNKAKFRGCQFGPCIGTDKDPQGDLFNDAILFSTLQPGINDWPTRVVFDFRNSTNAGLRLVAVRVYYGRTRVIHGLDVVEEQQSGASPAGSEVLDVKLNEGENITAISLAGGGAEGAGSSSAGPAMPNGVSVRTNQGRTISSPSMAGSVREVTGYKGANGVKGFFGLDSVQGLSRLLPVWA